MCCRSRVVVVASRPRRLRSAGVRKLSSVNGRGSRALLKSNENCPRKKRPVAISLDGGMRTPLNKVIDARQKEIKHLLREAKVRLPKLKMLLAEASSHWGYEDPIYRFYHQSFKVYDVQAVTLKIVAELRTLAPNIKLNRDFEKIITSGTDKKFSPAHNKNWLRHSRPLLEAFFHARHMLEMICKYAEELDEPPQSLPCGWATVLYLYNLR